MGIDFSDGMPWIFAGIFVAMFLIDMAGRRGKSGAMSLKESAFWVGMWISSSLIFAGILWHRRGATVMFEYLAGYVLEYSLSVDNLFVFVMIFSYFGVPPAFQLRVLKWGIIGAIVLRGIFIALGAVLLARYHWMIYVFGGFLVFTGVKMAMHQDETIDLEHNWFLKTARRILPLTSKYDGGKFFARIGGKLHCTPMFLVLLVVEGTDVIFALDSIPAIYGITNDPFIVYTSNIFAIMGLRALFFLLAGMLDFFRYLKLGVSIVLVFVGIKMIGASVYHISAGVSLAIVSGVLGASMLLSLIPKKNATSKDKKDVSPGK